MSSVVWDSHGTRLAHIHYADPTACRWSTPPRTTTSDRSRVTCGLCLNSLIVLERTVCPRCNENKLTRDEFYVRTVWADGSMRTHYTTCKACCIAAQSKWAKENREKVNAAGRRWYARATKDPERLAVLRVRYREAARRRHGIPPHRWRVDKPMHVHGYRWDAIDAGPFRDWLLSICSEFDSIVAMGTCLGTDDSLLANVMRGTKATVAFSTVDRALCGYGRPDLLDIMYPVVGDCIA